MANTEQFLSIQSFNQCTSLISIKFNTGNYLLWKSQVLPLIKSMGIEHHLTKEDAPEKEICDKDGSSTINPAHNVWTTNDGLLTSWLLDIISQDVMSMVEGTKTAYQVWKFLENQLLTMTKESEIHVSETFLTLKKGYLTLDEYLKKFKHLCDKLTAIKKHLDDLTKVLHLARGLGSKYQGFRTVMLSKAPYHIFNQFVLALKAHDQMLSIENEDDKLSSINHNHAYYSQRGRSRGRGRHFLSKGRGFPQNRPRG